jgi:transcriptional regulator with XRE-family HTH domain
MARRTAPPQSLAEAIRAARTERGWSQSKLARVLDTTEQSVHNWESGKYPSHHWYAQLCLVFGWPLPYSGNSSTAREVSFPEWPMPDEADDLAPALARG